MSAWKGEGDLRTQVRVRRQCDLCIKLAEYLIAFVLEGARTNPASSAYGKDDITWCSDREAFACEEHRDGLQRPPGGFMWGATFSGTRYPHMLLRWSNNKPVQTESLPRTEQP